jgi:hypothetical protein
MTSKPRSTSAEDDPTAPRRERSRRSAPAANRPLSDAAQNAHSPSRAPSGFDPSSDPSSSREALIAIAAYYRAERRGFLPGHEQEDWLAAEREVDGAGREPN